MAEEMKAEEFNNVETIKIKKLADEVQAGDDSLNKLRVQNLDFVLDIPLKVTVELGRTNVLIKDLLMLGQGSIVELDKSAGDALDIYVNSKLDRKSTRLNSSHLKLSRMPSSA